MPSICSCLKLDVFSASPNVNSLTQCMVCHLYVPTFLAPGNMPPAKSMVLMVFIWFCSGFSGTCTIFSGCHLLVTYYIYMHVYKFAGSRNLAPNFGVQRNILYFAGHAGWTTARHGLDGGQNHRTNLRQRQLDFVPFVPRNVISCYRFQNLLVPIWGIFEIQRKNGQFPSTICRMAGRAAVNNRNFSMHLLVHPMLRYCTIQSLGKWAGVNPSKKSL